MNVAALQAIFVVLNDVRVFRKITLLFRRRPVPHDVGRKWCNWRQFYISKRRKLYKWTRLNIPEDLNLRRHSSGDSSLCCHKRPRNLKWACAILPL